MLRAAAQFGLGFLEAHDTGDWADAAHELDRGLALLAGLEAPGADLLRGYLLCLRGECDTISGDAETGLKRAQEGAELIARHPEDRWGQGFAAWNVGFGFERFGEPDRAADCYADVVATQRDGSLVVRMIGTQSLAGILETREQAAEAVPLYDEALALCRRVGCRASATSMVRSRAFSPTAPASACWPGSNTTTRRRWPSKRKRQAERLQDMAAKAVAAEVLATMATPTQEIGTFRRQAAVWLVGLGDSQAMLQDSKGLRQLRYLLQSPGDEISVADLAVLADGEPREIGSGEPVLDREALAAYRKRLRALERLLAADEDALDDDQRERVRREHDVLARELARHAGLGGRTRRLGSPQERMRVNVTRTIRAAIAEIDTVCPTLGRHLAQSIATGSFCC